MSVCVCLSVCVFDLACVCVCVYLCVYVYSITDIDESCALSILSSLLIDGEKSPFYQSLIESGLGSDYAPTIG